MTTNGSGMNECAKCSRTVRATIESATELERRIRQIIADSESIQDSKESDYTKRCAKITAYEDIVELMGIRHSWQ